MGQDGYMDQLLTVEQAAAEVSCCEETIRRAYRAQNLKVLPFGRRNKRIRRAELHRWQDAGMKTTH
jgi:excisionase family DNA binding protein